MRGQEVRREGNPWGGKVGRTSAVEGEGKTAKGDAGFLGRGGGKGSCWGREFRGQASRREANPAES